MPTARAPEITQEIYGALAAAPRTALATYATLHRSGLAGAGGDGCRPVQGQQHGLGHQPAEERTI
ncbi:hypothetical protein ABZX40_07120 [Streptomyces sp. NPDC004610]|uniref:hypothetical protein n=1 Tax=unclassified Streptomyces TaxID=2593676 RepID=UPI0033B667F2